MSDLSSAVITVVLKGYPRLSETFIAQELRSLEQRGYRLQFVSLRKPTDRKTHPIHAQMQAEVSYLPEYLHLEPWRVIRAWWHWRRRPEYAATWRRFISHLKKDFSRNRVRRFGQALVMAHELAPQSRLVYAHFLHTPASVGWYAADLCQLPWAVSAHAKDIWTSPEWELREKLAHLAWLVTCTAANAEYLKRLAPDPERVYLQYHGIDLERFTPPPCADVDLDGAQDSAQDTAVQRPFTLISVGRAVPKKGYPTLLRALSRLPATLDWRFVHIGGGPERDALIQLASTLGIKSRIQWRGAQSQEAVLAAYREADVFVLASEITADGDRDGIPNVLMEAQSQRLCCIATGISGIPELITHEQTGLLVPPSDPKALAAAIEHLATEPSYRLQLAKAAQQRLQQAFDHRHCMDQLVALLEPYSTA